MKTLQESIIGRKNSSSVLKHDRTGLYEGDIVYFGYWNTNSGDQNRPYVVILNPDIYEKFMSPRSLKAYDCTEGVLITPGRDGSYGFMVLSNYDKNLKFKGKDNPWNITKVKRGYIRSHQLDELLNDIDHISNGFKIVFENGKWL